MQKVKNWLKLNNIDFSVVYIYDVDNQKLKIDFDKVLLGVQRKMGDEKSIIRALDNINQYYEKRKDSSFYQEKDRIDEIENFLREMAMNIIYENNTDFTWGELAAQTEYSVEFLKWWMSEKGIEDYQMLCEHDATDTYDHSGQFYNSVRECKKCNCDCDNFLENSDIELVWKAWNHKK
jgi:hypothetical protein